jgi:ATP-dependent Clp protease, protease subunit
MKASGSIPECLTHACPLADTALLLGMQFVPQVTELVVAQCVYLEGDEKNRNTPIYVYLNSTGCNNEQGQALSNDYEFFAMWSALGFTRAPIYTGCIGYAKNAAGILLSSGVKGHRYSWPHAQISVTPPVLNRVFGDTVDAQIQNNQLERVTKMYASILSKSTGKTPQQALEQYLTRKRHFDVKGAIEEGIIDKVCTPLLALTCLPGHPPI